MEVKHHYEKRHLRSGVTNTIGQNESRHNCGWDNDYSMSFSIPRPNATTPKNMVRVTPFARAALDVLVGAGVLKGRSG